MYSPGTPLHRAFRNAKMMRRSTTLMAAASIPGLANLPGTEYEMVSMGRRTLAGKFWRVFILKPRYFKFG